MANERYLLGFTKTLERAKYVSHQGGEPPYLLGAQRERLLPQIQALTNAAAQVSQDAMANGQVVAVVRMHPQALSRSAFPQALLRRADWRLLGSKPAWIRPSAGRGHDREELTLTTDLFVAATPAKLAEALPLLMSNDRLDDEDPIARDFRNLEAVRLMSADDRIKPGIVTKPDDLELVLHYDPTIDSRWRDAFTRFARNTGVQLDPGLEIASSGLLFMTATATQNAVSNLAKFTFLRAVRPLPEPRPLERPLLRAGRKKSVLPKQGAVDPNITIAIFDGGLPADHPFPPWANAIEPPGHHNIGAPVPEYQEHGIAVTSAALFGCIEPNVLAPRPYANVDHYRVLGSNTTDKKGHYKVLALIDEVLSQRDYPFISLSLGPPEPMDDDTVSPWTTLLDDHLGNGGALACVAVGNNGSDPEPDCRVMAPADSVNALGVGACTSWNGEWARAGYSAKGPGRTPGLIKPDVMHFGGSDSQQFLCAATNGDILEIEGTSFAAPGAMRMATGARAYFGNRLQPMALKALLVHCAERDLDKHAVIDVGWGRASHTLSALTVCPPGCARVIYAGKLPPSAVLRAPILIPPDVDGNLLIRATLCYSCRTDANTPGDYTRAGLEVTFRPHSKKHSIDTKGKKSTNAISATFFKQHDHIEEQERRLLAQKWNTVMHAESSKRVNLLHEPCFDLHYVAREPGLATAPGNAPEVHYALVVSIFQKKTSDLYERVIAAFPGVVSAIQPVISIEPSISV